MALHGVHGRRTREQWPRIVIAKLAGTNNKNLVGAKYGYALMDVATGAFDCIARTHDGRT
ncbi:MAG: hypothetical protein LQ340_002439, partial [Diploschistes diacapsis]